MSTDQPQSNNLLEEELTPQQEAADNIRYKRMYLHLVKRMLQIHDDIDQAMEECEEIFIAEPAGEDKR